ncbi:DNA-binding protein [Natronococcus sp. JC468]|uniref:helix-turn-helix domain-containing protein n=1 Tax=Natronococcus sp. JC468 TaxID=1961921 RepID=UPI001438AF2B|nr:helix-turn-helix domain-containing protein [Natronococcus sp. JC468]NKE34735.1 DNA-binding protein [Natronococcus sp. JC468]
MRYATVTLRWRGRRLTPTDERFGHDDAITVESIRYVNPVSDDDDRYVELLEVRGDLAEIRSLLAESPTVLEFAVTGSDDRGVVYVQWRRADLVDELLSILREHEIVVDWPMRFVGIDGDRGLEITAIGTSRAIQRAAADLPEGIGVELERLGEYEPGVDPGATMTERQRELFAVAVREGYYQVPRETTHRELAEILDLAPSTVGEHLQRIEAKLATAYATSMR